MHTYTWYRIRVIKAHVMRTALERTSVGCLDGFRNRERLSEAGCSISERPMYSAVMK